MDILQVLESALLHPDAAQRAAAEQQLADAAAQHFVEYLTLLTDALANDDAKTEVRMLAGLGLKNQLTAKDSGARAAHHQRWVALAAAERARIKQTALRALVTTNVRVAGLAAQLVAAIAEIELPRGEWPELIPTIIDNTKPQQAEHVKRASLLAIGYICESADPNNAAIVQQANGILIAIVQGCQALEPLPHVRLTALNALVNLLEFIRFNFEREGERNYIMQVVCEATQADSPELQAAAFGCLLRIMALYYHYMALYMEKALYGLTVSGMQSADDRVACMAVEFWLSVCEEELEIALQREEAGDGGAGGGGAEFELFNFALVALPDVLPTLLKLLTRQNSDPDDDDWLVAMAAGACLQLFAQNTGLYVVEPTLQFVAANIGNTADWRAREAAVMAFGSILDGPEREQLRTLVAQALEPILLLIKDEHLQVKETVAWCLGRITDLVVEAVAQNLAPVVAALATGLQDHPKVQTNCCWTLMNLLEQLCADGAQRDTTAMSPYYRTLVPLLLELLGRADNEFLLRALAYEALLSFVVYLGKDVMEVVQEVAQEALARLEATIGGVEESAAAKIELEEVQTNLLLLLTNIIRRAGADVALVLDSIMTMFLKLLAQQQQHATAIQEDVFIAVLAVAAAVGAAFTAYMAAVQPYLTLALVDTELPTCKTAIGVVADLAQALGAHMVPYLEQLMTILGTQLRLALVKRELRPVILLCFGDVATLVGAAFEPYVDFVMSICLAALEIEPEDQLLDTLDYVLNVKEACLDAYVGVVAGCAERPAVVLPYMQQIFLFIQHVLVDPNMLLTDLVARAAVGLLGDVAAIFPQGELKQAYAQPWMLEFIKKTRANAAFQPLTRDAARWAREQQKRQAQL
jgi:importin subunit beta-1